jgi:hypothetical protein
MYDISFDFYTATKAFAVAASIPYFDSIEFINKKQFLKHCYKYYICFIIYFAFKVYINSDLLLRGKYRINFFVFRS